MKSIYHDIYIPIYQNIIYPDKQLSGYIAHRLSRYRVGCICNRLLSLPTSQSTDIGYPLRNNRSCHAALRTTDGRDKWRTISFYGVPVQ